MDTILRDLEQTKKLISAIRDLTNIFVISKNTDLFSEVLSLVLHTMHSEYGIFGYIDNDGAGCYAAITDGIWKECTVQTNLNKMHPDKWVGTWGKCLRTQEVVIDNTGPFKTPEGHVLIKRVISVPITFQKKCIGHFTIANKQSDYDQDDISLMKWIAYWIAPVLSSKIKEEMMLKEKQTMQGKLAKVKNALFDMLNYANMYTLILDEHMNIRYINWSLSKVLGFETEDEPIGKCWLDFVPKSVSENLSFIHTVVITGDEPDKYREVVSDILTLDGKQRTVKWFNTKINHDYNWSFSFGMPVDEPLEITEESIRSYYRDIIEKDRTMIQSMREILTTDYLKNGVDVCNPVLENKV